MRIRRADYERLLAGLRAVYPEEGCGLLAGTSAEVEAVYPVTNRLASQDAYEMDPAEQVAAMLAIEEEGQQLLAIYHSHPRGPERPSSTDIAQAHYPEAGHLIISLQDWERPSARLFAIRQGQITELPLLIV